MKKYEVEIPEGYELATIDDMAVRGDRPTIYLHLRRVPAPPATLAVTLPRGAVEWLLDAWGVWADKDTTFYGDTIRACRAALAAEPAAECACGPCSYCTKYVSPTDCKGDSSACPVHGKKEK